MRLTKIIILVLTVVLFGNNSYGQHSIKGIAIDSNTKEPLAFVNIIFNNNVHSGTVSDIDGKFLFSSITPLNSLTGSYVGYDKVTMNLISIINKDHLVLELKASAFELQEVIVKVGENPANRIIRRVIENKKVNNPENISSFKYTSYNKVIYDFKPNDTLGLEQIQKKMDKTFKGGYVLIMESVTERKFNYPDQNEEVIVGTKVSGFKRPSFAPLATDIQPFSFYNDIIPIFDINYLNPISNGSLKKYQFILEDTLFQNQDTTFVLSFEPRVNKNIGNYSGIKSLI